MRSARSAEILRLLARKEVEFIVVGMTAGILLGVLGGGLSIRVLALAALIDIKENRKP